MFQRIRNLFQRTQKEPKETDRNGDESQYVLTRDGTARLQWLGDGTIRVIGGRKLDPDFVPPPSVYIPPEKKQAAPHPENDVHPREERENKTFPVGYRGRRTRQKEIEKTRKEVELELVYLLLEEDRVSEAKDLMQRILKNSHGQHPQEIPAVQKTR